MAGLRQSPDWRQKLKEYQDKYFAEHPGGDGGFFSLAGTLFTLAAVGSAVAGAVGGAVGGAGAASGAGAGAATGGAASGAGTLGEIWKSTEMARNALSIAQGVYGLSQSGKQGEEGAGDFKLPSPDYETAWKTYVGELQNINVNSNRSIADVTARLSAAGATPDSIATQKEFLEVQRKNKIGELEAGPTYSSLLEGFEIASGKRTNPYASSPAAPGEGATLLSYYSGLYGVPSLQVDSGASRARMGASGAIGGPGGGSSGGSPWLSAASSDTFW